MSDDDVAKRVAARYPTRFLRSYVRTKIDTDPVYGAVLDALRHTRLPILDLGCGAGVLPFFLREQGVRVPIEGIDHDHRKVAVAQKMVGTGERLSFRQGDVREPLQFSGNIVLLDVLHYFTRLEQDQILRAAASLTAPGGVVILRDAIRDGSWRFRLTWMAEAFARGIRWLRAERLDFPTRESIAAIFPAERFTREVRPLWGHTPFNNYLFVFRRSSEGMTNE